MKAASYEDRPYAVPKEFRRGHIGVVTVTYNSGLVLGDFISSIEGQTYQSFTIYVIDNASTDNSVLQLRGWDDDRLRVIVNERNEGVAAGNNQGICAAVDDGCEYILLLNNDVTFGPDLFRHLVEGLLTFGCSMVTPKCYFYEPSNVIWCAGGFFQPKLAYRSLHYGEGELDHGQYDVSRQVTYAPTCCVLIRRDVFGRIGLMDERYFVYSDDTDFMLRAGHAGEVLYYLADAKLWHKVNSLTGTASKFSMHYGARNRAFFIAKHVRFIYAVIAIIAYLTYYVLRFVVRKDSWFDCRIKLIAVFEGWQIPFQAGREENNSS